MCGRRRRDIGGGNLKKARGGALFLVLKNRGAKQGAGLAGRYWRGRYWRTLGAENGARFFVRFLFGVENFVEMWKNKTKNMLDLF